jgi:hypothetical protein
MLADMLQMKAVRVGYVGKAVESLEVGSPSQEIFDSVEWKFPRVHGMSDEISQFASEFRSAALVISKHIWLVDWLNDHPNDTLELHQGVGLELKQAWKHARLNGEPSNLRAMLVWLWVTMTPESLSTVQPYVMPQATTC